MAGGKRGIAQSLLLFVNTWMFIGSTACLCSFMYVFQGHKTNAMKRMSLLMVVFIVSIVVMLMSVLGCMTAMNRSPKPVARVLYLLVLLSMFTGSIFAGKTIVEFGEGLQAENELHTSARVNEAAERATMFLHNELNELYVTEKCTGGRPIGYPTLPFNFSKVECGRPAATKSFIGLLKDSKIKTKAEFYRYENCTADPALALDTKRYTESREFLKTFCGSESHIVHLAKKYAHYLVWFPVCLAGLTFILLLATSYMMCQTEKKEKDTGRWSTVYGDGALELARARLESDQSA